jgi:hypothetical protein
LKTRFVTKRSRKKKKTHSFFGKSFEIAQIFEMSSISRRCFLSNSASMMRIASSNHKFSSFSKIENPQKSSAIEWNSNHDPRKMRNVRGCVPQNDDRQLIQNFNFTKKINGNDIEKCEFNMIGI